VSIPKKIGRIHIRCFGVFGDEKKIYIYICIDRYHIYIFTYPHKSTQVEIHLKNHEFRSLKQLPVLSSLARVACPKVTKVAEKPLYENKSLLKGTKWWLITGFATKEPTYSSNFGLSFRNDFYHPPKQQKSQGLFETHGDC